MNNRTKTIYNTSIYSHEWTEIDDYNHRRLYAILGFRTLGDFLGMRVYDFLNMNQPVQNTNQNNMNTFDFLAPKQQTNTNNNANYFDFLSK